MPKCIPRLRIFAHRQQRRDLVVGQLLVAIRIVVPQLILADTALEGLRTYALLLKAFGVRLVLNSVLNRRQITRLDLAYFLKTLSR